jgi:hypothetical protein
MEQQGTPELKHHAVAEGRLIKLVLFAGYSYFLSLRKLPQGRKLHEPLLLI